MMPTTVKACWKSAGKTPEAGEGGGAASFSFRAILNAPLDCATSILEWTCSWDSAARQLSSAPPAAPSLFRAALEAPALPFPEVLASSTTEVRLLSQDKVSLYGRKSHLSGHGQSNGKHPALLGFHRQGCFLISSSRWKPRRKPMLPNSRSTAIPPPAPSEHLVPVAGLLQAVPEGSKLTLEWYSPSQVNKTAKT